MSIDMFDDTDISVDEGAEQAPFENGYDFGDMEDIVKTYDVGTNRGQFKANGHNFAIRPVCTDEFDKYCETLFSTQSMREDATGNNLSLLLISFFSDVNKKEEIKESDNKWYKKIYYEMFQRFYKNHKRYKRYPKGLELAKWIEKLVSVNNKKVTMYDLEIKYQLTKDEISRMIIYINKLSGFM